MFNSGDDDAVAKRAKSADDYFVCQCCGRKLPLTATFCRHCGASDECGWGENHEGAELDSPSEHREGDDNIEDDDFDYDEFVASEFPDRATDDAPIQISFRTVVIALVCIALLASAMIYGF